LAEWLSFVLLINIQAAAVAVRGLKPRWLAAAIKAGKKLDDFLIADSAASKSSGQKKAAKKKK